MPCANDHRCGLLINKHTAEVQADYSRYGERVPPVDPPPLRKRLVTKTNYPFETGFLPLSYSGNPGVTWRILQGSTAHLRYTPSKLDIHP